MKCENGEWDDGGGGRRPCLTDNPWSRSSNSYIPFEELMYSISNSQEHVLKERIGGWMGKEVVKGKTVGDRQSMIQKFKYVCSSWKATASLKSNNSVHCTVLWCSMLRWMYPWLFLSMDTDSSVTIDGYMPVRDPQGLLCGGSLL